MKKMWIAVCIIMTMAMKCAFAEGLLPTLSGTIGVPMPSVAEALNRFPEREETNEDGSLTEYYSSITETDFNTFSLYLEAKEAKLADYNVANGVLSATIQAKGESLFIVYRPQEESLESTYPKGTYDEKMKIAAADYQAAKEALEKGNYDEANKIFVSLKGYQDVDSILDSDVNLAAVAAAAHEAKIAPFKAVGSYVKFGTYPQTSSGTDQTEIEWLVLDYDAANHKSLLLSRYGLDAKPYNTERIDITWENCTLRKWLNDDFMNKAFTTDQQSAILTTAVDNSLSQGYSGWSTLGGNNTQEKIFLLSYAEANKYLNVTYENSENTGSRVAPTAYAIENGASTNSSCKTPEGRKEAGWWWLRSPGYSRDYAASVRYDGSLRSLSVSSDFGCVRPAFWLNLESGIF